MPCGASSNGVHGGRVRQKRWRKNNGGVSLRHKVITCANMISLPTSIGENLPVSLSIESILVFTYAPLRARACQGRVCAPRPFLQQYVRSVPQRICTRNNHSHWYHSCARELTYFSEFPTKKNHIPRMKLTSARAHLGVFPSWK